MNSKQRRTARRRDGCAESTGCSYQGKHFGAFYEDACCINGYLWDLDSCDEPGGPLHHGGEIPCPQCNAKAYEAFLSDDDEPMDDATRYAVMGAM